MKIKEWKVRIDRHDDAGRKLDSTELRVEALDKQAARQRATQMLMDEYDCDWSITSVRRTAGAA